MSKSKNFIPLWFCEIVFPTAKNFKRNFTRLLYIYTPNYKFYSIISKFDKVMPHEVQPPSTCSLFTTHLKGVYSDTTQLNSTRRRVELCRYKHLIT